MGGLIVHAAVSRRADGHALPVLAAAAACAPDLDLVLHLFTDTQHHRGPSHSLGLSVACGALVALAARVRGIWSSAARVGFVAAAAWFSHVVLDWLDSDSRLPLGLMALWPLSDAFFVAPFPVFMDVGRELSWRTLMHNTVAMAWESVLLVPLLAVTRRPRRTAGSHAPRYLMYNHAALSSRQAAPPILGFPSPTGVHAPCG